MAVIEFLPISLSWNLLETLTMRYLVPFTDQIEGIKKMSWLVFVSSKDVFIILRVEMTYQKYMLGSSLEGLLLGRAPTFNAILILLLMKIWGW